jgi:hypothetical protein
MATTTPAARSDQADRDDQSTAGQAVTVQLAVQGWAITRPGSTSPPDDPCDPAA